MPCNLLISYRISKKFSTLRMNQYEVPKKFLNINIENITNGKVGMKTEKMERKNVM